MPTALAPDVAAGGPAAGRSAERAADEAAVTTLLNCYLRETGTPASGAVHLDRLGLEVLAPLRYRSATGHHAYRLPATLAAPDGPGAPLDHVTLAALLGRELALAGEERARLGEFVAAVAESTRATAEFLAAAAARPGGPAVGGSAAAPTRFLAAEQSLAAGHPLHPTAKSRQPMTPDEVRRYAPELGAAFRLHWFRADPSVVAEDSALPAGAAETLARVLADDDLVDPAVRDATRAGGHALVPVHPWQAARLRERPAVRELVAAGLLADLGEQGRPWSPTSSVRTVYRPDQPYMLKLSLGVRITNSVRVNLAKELARGVEVRRLLAAGIGAELAARHPGFAIVADPAWLTVRPGDGRAESGFEVVVRDNPWPAGRDADATLVAGLCHPGPGGGRSRLATIVADLAAAEGRPAAAVARAWFGRYLTVAVDPLLWLYRGWGIALEAHQQNSVVELAGGWPAGFRYRDNQGYYFKASAAGRLRRLLPELNRASDTVCADAVADERFGYYVGVNHLFGIVGTLGRDGVADERELLADLAGYLADRVDPAAPAVATLLGSARLRCKANLRTRLNDMDELVGPLASQSVYVQVANPLHGLAPAAGWPA
jgi:siderophore synthetase component